jgi:tryptophan 2,3-dioxygenase
VLTNFTHGPTLFERGEPNVPKGIARPKQITLKRYTSLSGLMKEQFIEDAANNPDNDERSFVVIRQAIKLVLQELDKPEYMLITALQNKGVSQARSFLTAAESVLEQVDKKIYY